MQKVRSNIREIKTKLRGKRKRDFIPESSLSFLRGKKKIVFVCLYIFFGRHGKMMLVVVIVGSVSNRSIFEL